MKAYIKTEHSRFDYPDEMQKILSYLHSNGMLFISEEQVERLYRDFSEEKYVAGWMTVNKYILESFADWLSEYEV